MQDGSVWVELPDFGEVPMDAGDVASQAVDLRRGHPEGVVSRRAADGREDGRPRPVEFPQPRLDLRKLLPGSGVPRLDRLRSQRLGLRARAVAFVDGRSAVLDVDG